MFLEWHLGHGCVCLWDVHFRETIWCNTHAATCLILEWHLGHGSVRIWDVHSRETIWCDTHAATCLIFIEWHFGHGSVCIWDVQFRETIWCHTHAATCPRRGKIGHVGPPLQKTSSSDWKATATNWIHSNDLEACVMKCCCFSFHSVVKF